MDTYFHDDDNYKNCINVHSLKSFAPGLPFSLFI